MTVLDSKPQAGPPHHDLAAAIAGHAAIVAAIAEHAAERQAALELAREAEHRGELEGRPPGPRTG